MQSLVDVDRCRGSVRSEEAERAIGESPGDEIFQIVREEDSLTSYRCDWSNALNERDGLGLDQRIRREEWNGGLSEERDDATRMRLGEELSRRHTEVVDGARRGFSFILILDSVEIYGNRQSSAAEPAEDVPIAPSYDK